VLARLLENYVKKTNPEMDVIYFTWQPRQALEGDHKLGTGSRYTELLNAHVNPDKQVDEWLGRVNTLIIIDEAQLSYPYISLWTDFIKPQNYELWGPIVILFSSYGSPAETPFPRIEGSAPIEFDLNQRISIRPLVANNQLISLYFSRDEYDDVVARFSSVKDIYDQPFMPSSELLDYIWEFSSGHPATQPLGSILEAKPLHQGQKTRILGRGSQSCSHLYSTLPVPSQGEYQGFWRVY
jgi:hypothetical protein